jgi:hypothetical protein
MARRARFTAAQIAETEKATQEIKAALTVRWTPFFGPQRRAATFEPAFSLYASYKSVGEVSSPSHSVQST